MPFIKLLFILLFTSFLMVCGHAPSKSHNNAIAVRDAINNNDFEYILENTTLPLLVREQEWQTASDGHGFILGPSSDTLYKTWEQLKTIKASFLERIMIEGKTPISEPFDLDQFSEELKGKAEFWKKLTVIGFLRGAHDVEHIVLLGFDPNTHKLRAIYAN